MSGLAFVFAFGAAFAFNATNFLAEVPLFKEDPNTGQMVDITTQCTLTGPGVLCSIQNPSQDRLYWNDANKLTPQGGIPSSSVFVQAP